MLSTTLYSFDIDTKRYNIKRREYAERQEKIKERSRVFPQKGVSCDK